MIFFTASGQTALLVKVLRADGYLVCIPAEVRQEVENLIAKRHWDGSGLDQALAEKSIHFADVRGMPRYPQ